MRFRRNFGQTAALAAGFDHAAGEIVVTMDGDLQNDPADIPRLVAKIDEGYDLVNGWRVKRKDTFLTRRLPSMLANRLISSITGVRLHDYGCTLKAFRHEVVKGVSLYGEMHRFIPAIASGMGVEVAEIPVNHHPRTTGTSKYGLFRTVKVRARPDDGEVPALLLHAPDPRLRAHGPRQRRARRRARRPGSPAAALPCTCRSRTGRCSSWRSCSILVGVQFVTMGLLAELQTRIYHEAQQRPTYTVRETLGI